MLLVVFSFNSLMKLEPMEGHEETITTLFSFWGVSMVQTRKRKKPKKAEKELSCENKKKFESRKKRIQNIILPNIYKTSTPLLFSFLQFFLAGKPPCSELFLSPPK